MIYVRKAYSPNATATQTAKIKVGTGDWEITALSVVMGGKTPALNGIQVGAGDVSFVTLEADKTTVREKQYLISGRCTQLWPMIMDSSKMVAGPGEIRSTILHPEETEHTLVASYRRVR